VDLVVAVGDQKSVAVLSGQGGGGFGNAVLLASGVQPRWLQVVDVNCDGIPDVLASSGTENKLGLLFGTGTGLAAPQLIDLSTQQSGIAQALAVRDVNFDGLADLVVGSNQAPAYLLIANVSP